MKGTPSPFKIALGAASIMLLAGCGTGLDRASVETNNEISLSTMSRDRTIDGVSVEAALSDARSFLAAQQLTYADHVLVTGGDRPTRSYLVERLSKPGLRIGTIDDDASRAPLKILVLRTVATPPTCGDWSDDPVKDFSNLPPRNYGCASQSNLARMVADPADLASGQASPLTDSQRHAKIMNAYRNDNIVITEYSVTDGPTSGGSSGGGE